MSGIGNFRINDKDSVKDIWQTWDPSPKHSGSFFQKLALRCKVAAEVRRIFEILQSFDGHLFMVTFKVKYYGCKVKFAVKKEQQKQFNTQLHFEISTQEDLDAMVVKMDNAIGSFLRKIE